jgi:NAD(P)-dependent dehydrogenase (short-subunit alcohol dehydrogenase family)
MEGRLKDKVAIVTGAGRGIGKAVALRLAREGAHVVVAECDAEAAHQAAGEVRTLGVLALAYPIDIADVAQIQPMVAKVVETFGRIDILVNNAGRVQTKPMLDLTEDDWDRIVSVNQRGLFFCLQAVAQQMIAQIPDTIRNSDRAPHSFGKIVNFSSVAGRSGRPNSTHYAASKAAVISITRSAALALARYNINVNAVCPGIVLTAMWQEIDQANQIMRGLAPGEWIQRSIETVPLKRVAQPEDIAAAVAFLCSPDADYITGQALNVDGGLEMD